MGKAERAAALTTRRNCIAIIKNLRYTRNYLAKHAFDERAFKHLNGSDRGIENLVGKNITFSLLSDDDRLALHREICSKLNETEIATFEVLRKSVVDYFKDLEAVISNAGYQVPREIEANLASTKEAAIESFNKTMNAIDAFDCERTVSTLEKLSAISNEVEETVPDIEHELDVDETEDENEDDDHSHDDGSYGDLNGDEVEPAPEPEEPLDEPVELPDDDEDEPVADDDDDDFDIYAKTGWTKDYHRFIKAAMTFVTKEDYELKFSGFTVAKAKDILTRHDDECKHYREVLGRVIRAFDPKTCPADHLLRGSTDLMKRIDRIVSLAVKMEDVRKAMDKSCERLVVASKNMHDTAIIDPYS